MNGEFISVYDPTIEANFRKQISIEDTSVMLDILDTAGQDEYSVLREQYMTMGEGFVLVYAIDTPLSFKNVIKFHGQAKRCAKGAPCFILAGNKCDMEDDRTVSADEGKALANNLGCDFFETSAKTNKNVDELFLSLVKKMHAARSSSEPKKKSKCIIL